MSAPREPMDIHTFFSLSYASYLVLPRSVLQSMSIEWQHRFVDLLWDAEAACAKAGIEQPADYFVRARDGDGRFVRDPLRDYQRGRRDVFREAAR